MLVEQYRLTLTWAGQYLGRHFHGIRSGSARSSHGLSDITHIVVPRAGFRGSESRPKGVKHGYCQASCSSSRGRRRAPHRDLAPRPRPLAGRRERPDDPASSSPGKAPLRKDWGRKRPSVEKLRALYRWHPPRDRAPARPAREGRGPGDRRPCPGGADPQASVPGGHRGDAWLAFRARRAPALPLGQAIARSLPELRGRARGWCHRAPPGWRREAGRCGLSSAQSAPTGSRGAGMESGRSPPSPRS